ncbi:M15 family metallopeptidase [Streptomyces sp. SBT349]|uniref:M15 family metallopeptidase n=1 Tax=Streptomyces sp. SBT349 TaxID=1580539 RepID=UPI001F22F22E|nr:M15 family metallopeptidase [Streptomyces sp. SBT349]
MGITVAALLLILMACARATPAPPSSPGADPSADGSPSEPPGAEEDGTVPDGARLTPFDTEHPAVANLEPWLLAALQQAAEEAREDGVELLVTSGWRSEEHQRRLLEEAIEEYGSLERAREFVNTPERSTHVSGEAVDIGPTDADDWLIRNGSRYGLCQVYANEMWHFELLTEPGGTCPPLREDAAG